MEKLHAFKKNFIEIGFFFSFVVVVLLAVERNGFWHCKIYYYSGFNCLRAHFYYLRIAIRNVFEKK